LPLFPGSFGRFDAAILFVSASTAGLT